MRKLLLIPMLFAAGACDGGSGPAGDAHLTAAEAAELNRAVLEMVSGLAQSGVPGGAFDSAPMDQNTFTAPIRQTVPCTPSGSVDLDGTVTIGFDHISLGMSMQADLSATPEACAHRMESGDVIKISGDPDLDVRMSVAGNADQLTALQVTETGAFTWTRGGASGRCLVNIASSLDAATQMVAVTGTFCGFPVSETVPVEG
jgi:hypothetical protein